MNAVVAIAPPSPSVHIEVFTRIPPQMRVCAVADNYSLPLFRQGEVAVYLDQPKTYPEHGQLYIVEYGGLPIGVVCGGEPLLSPRRQTLMQAHHSVRRGEDVWNFRTYAGPHWADGPYSDNTEMARKVLGPVVGIYSTSGKV